MLKTQGNLFDLAGIPVRVITATGSEILNRSRSGTLYVTDDRSTQFRALHKSDDEGDLQVRQRVRELLDQGLGLDQPLIWNLRRSSTSVDDPEFDLDQSVASTDIDTAIHHQVLLEALQDPKTSASVSSLRFLIFVIGPTGPTELQRLRRFRLHGSLPSDQDEQDFVERVMELCPELGAQHLETSRDHVATRSRSVTSTRQLQSAIKASWFRSDQLGAAVDQSVQFLAHFWTALAELRPEFAPRNARERIALRGASLATTSLGLHAVVAVSRQLFELHNGVWGDTAQASLSRSVLARHNSATSSLSRANEFETSLKAASNSRDVSRIVLERLEPHLNRAGGTWIPASGENDVAFREMQLPISLYSGRETHSDSTSRRRLLPLAGELVSKRNQDFFDLDAPWWIVGGIIGYRWNSSPGDPVRRLQARSDQAKRWVADLAVASLKR